MAKGLSLDVHYGIAPFIFIEGALVFGVGGNLYGVGVNANGCGLGC